mgnify:CR=1 FL=1
MLRIARALFFTGVAWVLPSAALAWVLAGIGMPLQVPLGLAISTLLILCGLALGRAQGARMLRWSALFIGMAMLAIGLAHNVIAMSLPLPNLLRRSFQAADTAAALSGFVLMGISIAVCGLLLCILVARLEREDATARLVTLVLALYYLMAGTLTGVLIAPLTETWAPVWLAFGVWLLGALVCSAPAKADRPKS